MTSDPDGGVCLLRRVVIRNYKSIAACDVELGPLTFLVGPNGSGKSNFLDALRFVSDSLRNSLEYALRERGGMNEVLRQSPEDPAEFGLRLEFSLPSGDRGYYAFDLRMIGNGFTVEREECLVTDAAESGSNTHYYRVTDGIVGESTLAVEPAVVQDRLYLVNLSGTPAFRPVYDGLSRMAFYSPNPDAIRDLQPHDPGEILARDGSNLSSVLRVLAAEQPARKSRVEEYLAQVVPGVVRVDATAIGPRETLAFHKRLVRAEQPWPFLAHHMSDGTLRALGILVALFHGGAGSGKSPLLVGIEEPETALHPAAAEVLIDSLRDASEIRQVLVTSHSPDLLDNASISDGEILAFVAEEGESQVGRLDEAGRSVLRDHLFTPGELLRMDQLRPDSAAMSLKPDELILFGTAAGPAGT